MIGTASVPDFYLIVDIIRDRNVQISREKISKLHPHFHDPTREEKIEL